MLNEISEAMQKGNAKLTVELVTKALDEKIAPQDILENGLLAGMGVVGRKFKANEIFVPEVLVAARAMNKAVEILKPALVADGVEPKGRVVIGTVKGDLHDIGKNLVKMMMEGKGLEMIDVGVNVEPEQFLQAARESGASVICCSALLTTTMNEMKAVVDLVKASDLANNVKVLVGGAPITQSFCDSIGADGYAPDASTAADLAMEYIA